MTSMKTEIVFKAIDDELQVVYGEIYAPDIPDAHVYFMTREEVMKMAHNFLRNGNMSAIDTNHDNRLNGSALVESFIARDGDEIFVPGSWVGGVHIPDVELWDKVKSGELNGFSMEAMVHTRETQIVLEIPEFITGTTEPDDTGHQHIFEVTLDNQARISSGRTDIVNGHFHSISSATVTGPANGEEGEHTHRFSIVEDLNRV